MFRSVLPFGVMKYLVSFILNFKLKNFIYKLMCVTYFKYVLI